MTAFTLWILVMVQNNVLTIVNTYPSEEACVAAESRAPATTVAYCLEAKRAVPKEAPGAR